MSGYAIDMDGGVMTGDYTYHPESGRIGKVVDDYTVRFDDDEHPENELWLNGEEAGADIADMIAYEVDFGDVTELFVLVEDADDLVLATPAEITDDEAEDVVAEAEARRRPCCSKTARW